MVDDKYWQLLKRSLADQHRQYLEEVTEPMSLGFDAPEEFVTSKPSIYHSLRMQPIASLDTGKIRAKPARARRLYNDENREFQESTRNFSLPLRTNQGEFLYGRHVYPGELYSLNRSFNEKHLPDVPNSYKQGWGNNDKFRPLNLYGFTGNSPIPQRHTATTFQPEGILYGDLDENDIVQLNRKPATAYTLAQVARAISPFHESMNLKRLGRNQQELASDIMEAGIPPILAESNVDTTGKTHALPFRIDEVSDVQEAHDPFVQWRPDSLMTSSPEGLEQFTLDNLRRSEPMDLAMQLLKEEAPYGSKDYPPQEIAVSTGTPLMGSKNSGPTPEVCNIPGCESGLPPVVYRRMANPIRSIDNHEFMCEQCAYKNDMQSLLYHKMLKGEITLAEFTMRLLKEEPLHLQGSNTLARRAREELETDMTGQNSPAYQEMMERMMDIYEPQDETISLEDNLDQYAQETGKNPWRSLPGREMPNKHGGTAKVHLAPITPIHTQPFYDWQAKNASEPMDIAMRLLKMPLIPESIKRVSDNRAEAQFQDPITNQVYPMVAEKNPKYGTMNVGIYPNQPGQNLGKPLAIDALDMTDKDIDKDVIEMLGLGLSNAELAETIEDNPYYESDMTWTHPKKRRRGYASALYDLVNQLGEQKVRPSDNQTHDGKQLWSKRMLPKGEPMEIAMQLLKERVSPEAKQHKLEYDKKYESSPERVKYREELNRERRRRHIMGQGGPDMSHTKDHTIVPEDSHTNRARHFKDKGTLL
jgi:hypothetical protein